MAVIEWVLMALLLIFAWCIFNMELILCVIAILVAIWIVITFFIPYIRNKHKNKLKD